MIATLRHRDFLLAWTGGLISMIGDWALSIALPLYIYQLTGSALTTSLMFVARVLPALALGSVAGVFVDRWDRRRTMLISNVLMAATLLPLLLVRSPDLVWLAYGAAFAQALVVQFFRPAENALLPHLVPDDLLPNANALNALNNNLARLIGPALGGVVAAMGGLDAVVLVNIASFLLAAGAIALIRTSGRAARSEVAAASHPWRRVREEWTAGLALVRRDRVVSLLLGLMAVTQLGEGVMSTMFVVWVRDVLDGGAQEMGWLMSGQAVGGVIGGVLLGAAAGRFTPLRLLGVGSVVFGLLDLALFTYPLAFTGVWIGVGILVLVGIPVTGMMTGFATLLQQAVEDAYRGRVFGVMGTLSALLFLIGTLIAGTLGDALGPITLLTIQAGSYVVVGLLALRLVPPAMAAARPSETDAPHRIM